MPDRIPRGAPRCFEHSFALSLTRPRRENVPRTPGRSGLRRASAARTLRRTVGATCVTCQVRTRKGAPGSGRASTAPKNRSRASPFDKDPLLDLPRDLGLYEVRLFGCVVSSRREKTKESRSTFEISSHGRSSTGSGEVMTFFAWERTGLNLWLRHDALCCAHVQIARNGSMGSSAARTPEDLRAVERGLRQHCDLPFARIPHDKTSLSGLVRPKKGASEIP